MRYVLLESVLLRAFWGDVVRGAPQVNRKRRPQTWTMSLLLSSRRSSSRSGSLLRMVPPGLVLLMFAIQTCEGAIVEWWMLARAVL